MDFISKVTGQNQNQSQGDKKPDEPKEESSGGLMGKLNSMAGGGKDSEKNEDALDKAVDWTQERLGQGKQDNESAVEQAKDEQISDFIRDRYKQTTGKDFFVADKDKKFGS